MNSFSPKILVKIFKIKTPKSKEGRKKLKKVLEKVKTKKFKMELSGFAWEPVKQKSKKGTPIGPWLVARDSGGF